MAKRRHYNQGPYRYTPRRKAALKRAQFISARKRKGQRNKRIAVGVIAVAGIAGAAYAGHKYGGHAGGIASDLRGRFNSSRFTMRNSHKSAFQPGAQAAGRIANSIAPASTPRIKVSKSLKPTKGAQALHRTHVPTISRDAQKDLMARATAPKKPVLNDDGSVKQFVDRGVPKELIGGKPITARTAHGAISANEKAKVRSGGSAKTVGQRRTQVNDMIAEGTVQPRTQGKKARSKVVRGGLSEQQWEDLQGSF